jgi:N-methylhydantoinase A
VGHVKPALDLARRARLPIIYANNANRMVATQHSEYGGLTMTMRIAVDTGGTFTDVVGLDLASGDLLIGKTPSIPAHPEQAVLNGLRRCAATPEEIDLLLLGTTVATNALLERKGARVIYLTTAGFTDTLFIQRVNRRYHYDLTWRKPDPIPARRDCIGVRERINKEGQVLVPLDDAEVDRIVALVRERMGEEDAHLAIAINLLFSYANPAHEQMLGRRLRAAFPEVPVSLSHNVAPIWREYERGSTTAADAYVKPIIAQFVTHVEDGLRRWGYRGPFSIVKSNGGSMLSSAAKDNAIHVLLSGLAGGLIAGKHFGALAGSENVVSLDMGGTSTDVGAITGGQIGYTTEYQIEWGMPIAAPFMDLITIGAGGGSMAWVDKGGFLKVGPRSAGSDPGPICYGRGGTEPTVTDANLALGRLNPAYFLGGEMALDPKRATQRLHEFGAPLGLTGVRLAKAIVDLADANMADAIRLMTVQRGLDPRKYDLVAFGGAGPLHATALARAVGMRRIIIPPHPGLGSAFGALLADLRVDKVWTQAFRSDRLDCERVDREFARMTAEALLDLRNEGFTGIPTVQRSISMRYIGQNYEQEVAVPAGPITAGVMHALLEAFHRQHEAFYGYRIGGEVIQLVHFTVTAVGAVQKPALKPLPVLPPARPVVSRPVYFHEKEGFIACPVYRRADLGAGAAVEGPALIEEEDSTTLLHPGQELTAHTCGLILSV